MTSERTRPAARTGWRRLLLGPVGPDALATEPPVVDRPRTRAEIAILLLLSLGSSAIYAVITIISRLTAVTPLNQQTATLNASQSPRQYLDLTYQLVGIGLALAPVALAIWLLSANGRSWRARLGLTRGRAGRDALVGCGFAALIGLPGLGFYFVGKAIGITVNIAPAALNTYWWTVPVLLLSAARSAISEEVIVVGYLLTRLRGLRWSVPAALVASAVLRGSYHLYQGIGPFFGNAVMGLIFAEWYRRTRRVGPLILAHFILDTVSFVGYQLLGSALGLK